MKLLWPCDRSKVVITSTFQDHKNRPGYKGSLANDLASYGGVKLPILASQTNGVVIRHGWDKTGYGNESTIEYGGVIRVQNAHMDSLAKLSVGDKMSGGDLIGIMGTTGSSSGIHDHFAVWVKRGNTWVNVDPLDPSNDIQMVSYLGEETPEPEPEPPAEFKLPIIPEHAKARCTVSGVRIRAQPITGQILGYLEAGNVVSVLGFIKVKENYWFLILMPNNLVGWSAAYAAGATWLEVV